MDRELNGKDLNKRVEASKMGPDFYWNYQRLCCRKGIINALKSVVLL